MSKSEPLHKQLMRLITLLFINGAVDDCDMAGEAVEIIERTTDEKSGGWGETRRRPEERG